MEWTKKNKGAIIAKENSDWIKLNGDLAYIDPRTDRRITFADISRLKLKSMLEGDELKKKMRKLK